MINEECNIILAGLQRKVREFDNLSEYVVFSVIQTMTQARRGQYDGNLEYLAEWSMLSTRQVSRHLQNLVAKGYITAEPRVGNTTIYQAVQINETTPQTKYDPRQNVTPAKNVTPTPAKNVTPHLKYNNINNPPPPNAHARGIEKLKEWVDSSNLTEYAQRKLYEYNSDLTTDNLLVAFYEDVLVQEDVENNQRRDVISHYQKWIPKYLKSINDERTNQRQSSNRAADPFADLERIAATMRPDGSRSE